jgi:hypothetical protein
LDRDARARSVGAAFAEVVSMLHVIRSEYAVAYTTRSSEHVLTFDDRPVPAAPERMAEFRRFMSTWQPSSC